MRLDKYLANLGVCSRRAVSTLLESKNVTINGKRVTKSGERINPNSDTILINGQIVKKPKRKYYLLNKPMGYISTTSDEFSRDNVVSLIKFDERIYPVGRLDKNTTGLLLLTNDGTFTYRLTHPKHTITKTYRLTISGSATKEQLALLQTGVPLEDGVTYPAEVTILKQGSKITILEMTIHEGRNRQIRRMCAAVGIELISLERTAIGPLRDTTLKSGDYRELTKEEVAILLGKE